LKNTPPFVVRFLVTLEHFGSHAHHQFALGQLRIEPRIERAFGDDGHLRGSVFFSAEFIIRNTRSPPRLLVYSSNRPAASALYKPCVVPWPTLRGPWLAIFW
jgi:hypothetical protein